MALKLKISKTDFDALPEHFKAEYKAAGMDYVLDVDGLEDTGELKRAKDREVQKARELKTKLEAAETRVTELETELNDESNVNARKKGDIATLEASWKTKLEAAEKKGTEAVTKLREFVKKNLVGKTAEALATELSTAPKVLLPHILGRLSMDFEGEEPALRILDAEGKPSALTVDDLKKEVVANADFAAIIVGSKGAGGGAPGGRQNGGGATKKLSEMNSTERAEFQKRDPEGFKKESAAQQVVRI